MATTLFQAISAVPGRIYSAFGDFTDLVTGRKAERLGAIRKTWSISFPRSSSLPFGPDESGCCRTTTTSRRKLPSIAWRIAGFSRSR